MIKIALLIDGGHLRSTAGRANIRYDNDFIEDFAKTCHDPATESLQRILYYDCVQYRGKQTLPVSGAIKTFAASDAWLDDLASRQLFAVRRGVLAFRGWVPRNVPIGRQLTDADFKPNFEQKGVDMRIGLDIALISAEHRIDKILLVTADTDLIPAMKHARRAGIQVTGIQLPVPPAIAFRPQFLAHIDFKKDVPWPPTSVIIPPAAALAAPGTVIP